VANFRYVAEREGNGLVLTEIPYDARVSPELDVAHIVIAGPGVAPDLARVASEAHFAMSPSRKKAIVIVVDGQSVA
jgi:hypothetical protein